MASSRPGVSLECVEASQRSLSTSLSAVSFVTACETCDQGQAVESKAKDPAAAALALRVERAQENAARQRAERAALREVVPAASAQGSGFVGGWEAGVGAGFSDIEPIEVAKQAADVVVAVVDEAARILGNVTEAELSDRMERVLRDFVEALDSVAAELPGTREQFEAQGWLNGRLPPACPTTSQAGEEEIIAGILVARAVLVDVRAALAEVSRDEVEEFVEVGLAVARAATAAARVAARQVQRRVDAEAQFSPRLATSTVVIEEVDCALDGTALAGGVQHALDGKSVKCTFPSRRRFIWQPLWPKVKAWTSSPSLPRFQCVGSVATGAIVCAASPLLFMIGAFTLPLLLVADVALQRIYSWKQREVEDCLEGVSQVARLTYVSTRIAIRRGLRVARLQLARASAGRSLGEMAADVAKSVWRDPLGAVTAVSAAALSASRGAAEAAARGVRGAWGLWQRWRSIP